MFAQTGPIMLMIFMLYLNQMEEFKVLEKLPRRIQTKFEKKGLALGHSIYEFAFQLLR